MEHRIEEFTKDEKKFIYFDLAEFKTNEEYRKFVEIARKYISNYAPNSLYTITNVKSVSFDTETKSIIADWMKYNKPYVKYGTVIGFDGIKRIIVNAIFKLSGRKNMSFIPSREQAIEWLLKQK